MRLIDADEIRIKPNFILYGVCGTPVIRCEDLARIINDMPTIELQKWIPVSESKPGFPCIVSDAHGNISTPYGIIGLSDIEHGKWYVDARNDRNEIINGQPASLLCWENRIVAWMPLPEPYKEEQHD